MSVMDAYSGFADVLDPNAPTKPTPADMSQWTSRKPAEQTPVNPTTEQVREESVTADPYSEFAEVDHSQRFKSDMRAFGEAGVAEAIRGGGAIAGAGIGGTLGAAGGPVGAVVGGVVGLVAGAMIGDKARTELGLTAAEENPAETRAIANVGSVLGGSAVPAAGIYGMARTGFRFGPVPGSLQKPSMTGATVNDLADFASTSKIWAGRETMMTGYSATGGFIAGAISPDNEGLRMGMEIAAPLMHNAFVSSASGSIRATRNLVRMLGKEGQETVAGMFAVQAWERSDGDPVKFYRMTRDFAKNNPEFDAAYLTPGQMTGDVAAINIEKSLASIDSKFGERAAQSIKDGLEAVRAQVALFTSIGTPDALELASVLRIKYYDTLNELIIKSATQDAIDAVARISGDTPRNAREISRAASEALGSSVENVRLIETDLWNKVENIPTTQVGALRNYFETSALSQDIPPSAYDDIPVEVRKFLYRMFVRDANIGPVSEKSNDLISVLSRDKAAQVPDVVYRGAETNTNELQKMRSRFLQMARAANKDPEKANMARVYNELAESLLDDIDTAFDSSGATDAYTAARNFTKSKHDAFTRTFAGEATAQGRYGNRIDPEILLRRAMATGGDVTALRMMELEQATRFVETQGYASHESYQVMMDAQDRMIRLMAIDAYDPATQTISVTKLRNFNKKHGVLLEERFPQVKQEIENAIQFSDHRKELVDMINNDTKTRRVQSLVGKLAGGGDPVDMSAKILQSPRADRKLGEMITELKTALKGQVVDPNTRELRNLTKSERTEALQGAASSVFEAAIRKSIRTTTIGGQPEPVLSPQMFRSMMFDAPIGSNDSVIDVLVREGVVPSDVKDKMKRVLDVASNLQQYKDYSPSDMENQFSTELAILLSRLVGSGTVGWLARKSRVGSSIIIHGAAARYAQKTATALPQNKIINILVDAFSDSTNDWEKLRLLMDRSKDPMTQIQNSRQLHAWFIRAGYMTTAEVAEEQMKLMNIIQDTTILDQEEQ